jgi:hypothetical protein
MRRADLEAVRGARACGRVALRPEMEYAGQTKRALWARLELASSGARESVDPARESAWRSACGNREQRA